MRKRWVVDAMNLIGSRPDGWWNDPDKAMRRLAAELDGYAAATGDAITVVFDKAPRDPVAVEHIEVRIAHYKGRNAADHEIEMIVAEGESPETLLVVTSDKRLAEKVRAAGATVVGSGSFRRTLDRDGV